MTKGIARRLAELEQAARPPGKLVVVYLNDWRNPTAGDIAEDEQRLADARANLGADDRLLVVEYVRGWKALKP